MVYLDIQNNSVQAAVEAKASVCENKVPLLLPMILVSKECLLLLLPMESCSRIKIHREMVSY